MTRVQTQERIASDELARIFAPEPEGTRALVPVTSSLPAEQPAAPAQPPDLIAALLALGIAPLGVQSITAGTTTVDGQPWKLSALTPGTSCRVPPSVASRATRAQALGIPFAYWLAEEQPIPVPRKVAPRVRRFDPILLGIIPLGDGRGLVCSLGAWDHPPSRTGSR